MSLHIRIRESVLTRNNRCIACGLDGRCQELDMGRLIKGNVFEVVVVSCRVPSFLEVLKAEFGKGALVERIFEMLEL